MILYNVTVNVESEIEEEWLKWMQETHLPKVLATGAFEGCKIFKLLSEEPQGITYAFQYSSPNLDAIDTYLAGPAPELQNDVVIRYGNKVMSFRTLLEEVG